MVPSALAPSTDASFNLVVSTPVTSNTQLTGSEAIIPLESFLFFGSQLVPASPGKHVSVVQGR